MKFNHLLSLGFEVESNDPDGEDITWEMVFLAAMERLISLVSIGEEWKEAVLPPEETYEKDE